MKAHAHIAQFAYLWSPAICSPLLDECIYTRSVGENFLSHLVRSYFPWRSPGWRVPRKSSWGRHLGPTVTQRLWVQPTSHQQKQTATILMHLVQVGGGVGGWVCALRRHRLLRQLRHRGHGAWPQPRRHAVLGHQLRGGLLHPFEVDSRRACRILVNCGLATQTKMLTFIDKKQCTLLFTSQLYLRVFLHVFIYLFVPPSCHQLCVIHKYSSHGKKFCTVLSCMVADGATKKFAITLSTLLVGK